MIISGRFVFTHPAKGGGSFVTEVLTAIYAGQCGYPIINCDKHGDAARIPVEHRSKQIVTTVRNPFDHYASHYHFGYWISRNDGHRPSFWDDDRIAGRFPSYPYLSFPEFLEAALEIGHRHEPPALQAVMDTGRVGPMTLRLIRFSTPEYLRLLEDFSSTGDIAALKQALGRTKFLHTESLNQDTYDWLLELGVPPEVARPVLSKAKVQPLNTPGGVILDRGHGQARQTPWQDYFDAHTKAAVEEREWLFFELFPEYRGASTL